jgi:long-chain acyl-CoA synthetase
MNLAEVLFQSEARFGARTAVTDLGTGCILTYQSLADEARTVAALLTSHGVQPGQRIALIAPNGAAYLVASFGLLAAGACIVPIAANLAAAEVRQILTEIDVHACLSFADANSKLDATTDAAIITTGPCTGFAFRWIERDAPHPDGFAAMNAAFVRFTSGTTAQARGVVISHEGTLARVEASNRVLRITEHDRILWVLPLAYHFAVTIVSYVRAGAHTILCPDALPQVMVDAIRRFEATVMYASPLHFERLGGLKSGGPLASLRLTLSTSAPIRKNVIERFEAVYGVPVCQAYGIIEAGLPCINTRLDGTPPAAVGRPVPGYEIAIVDESGKRLSAGATGEVWIRGSGLFMGYYKPWQPFAAIARDGWLATGDLGSLDETGALTLSGRKKALISMGGVKFFPEEVEDCINGFPGIKESRVFGRAHAHLGEIPCGEVATSGPIDLHALRQHCLETLSAYKVPIVFTIVDAVPRTAGGKILRQRLTDAEGPAFAPVTDPS